MPGEKLLTKLWESIADKGIASLLKPWQVRREGRAAIDVRRTEMLALAQAELDVEAIRCGRKILLPNGTLVEPVVRQDIQVAAEPLPLAIPYIEETATRNAQAEFVRREIALAKAVLHAEEELKNDAEVPSGTPISDDWLLRWRDCAAGVSSEELQSIWGKVLAGEIKAPGRYSLRTLEFLKNLSQDEAKAIEKISPFVVNGVIYRDDAVLNDQGVQFGDLLALQEIGVIAGVDGLGLQIEWNSLDPVTYERALTCHGSALIVKANDPKKIIKLKVCTVTSIGKQILQLSSFQPNERMLLVMADKIKTQGFQVELGRYFQVNGSQLQVFDLRPL